jgi:large subunit ribosomal protein L24
LFGAGENSPILGRMNVQVEVEGEGATPRALIGSLNGTGTVSLEKAELAKLDPKVFAGAMRAVDQGMALEAGKLRDFVAPALDAGRLTLKDAEGAIGIVNGQARLGTVIAKADGADLSASGSLDLATLALDGRLILTATNAPAFAGRPELTIGLKGTLAAPRREIDVSALAGWLALRAVDQQSKKLEQIEAERSGRAPAPATVSPVTAPVAPPASSAPKAVAPLPPPLEIKPAPRAAAPARSDNMRPDPSLTDRDRFFNSQR